jgi:hypothetical protein
MLQSEAPEPMWRPAVFMWRAMAAMKEPWQKPPRSGQTLCVLMVPTCTLVVYMQPAWDPADSAELEIQGDRVRLGSTSNLPFLDAYLLITDIM